MQHEVIVIGGGPAGSTAANLLAQHGVSVLLLDKEVFPRFHIGESLLPCDLPIFKKLGVKLDDGPYIRKDGAEFIDERTNEHVVFSFSEALGHDSSYAYQVERALFDHLLMQRAEEVGAKVQQGEKVLNVECTTEQVRVTTDKGDYNARFLIDATGQDAFLARRQRSIEPIKGFGRSAVFCHFSGLSSRISEALLKTGNIKVLIVEAGWVWLIPLHGNRISVGVVTQKSGVTAELLDQTILDSQIIQEITQGATRTPTRMIGNFSFRNAKPWGIRHTCIGDASAFLDPVFSSGVALAMLGAEHMTELLVRALKDHREAEPALMQELSEHMKAAYKSIGSLIYSFYNTGLVSNVFFSRDPDHELRAGLISLLAGDWWRTGNRFQQMLMNSARRWQTFDEATTTSPATSEA